MKVVLVALPETTPVTEAARLQDDLRRAKIWPAAWVVSRSLVQTGMQTRCCKGGSVERRFRSNASAADWHGVFLLPFLAEPSVGISGFLVLT